MKTYIKHVVNIFICLLLLIACSKEITDSLFTLFEVSFTEKNKDVFLNIPQPTNFKISPQPLSKNDEGFQLKYEITSGEGYFLLDSERIQENEFISLSNSEEYTIEYVGVVLDTSNVTISIQDEFGRKVLTDLIFNVKSPEFDFDVVANPNYSYEKGITDLDLIIKETNKATYQVSYEIIKNENFGTAEIRDEKQIIKPQSTNTLLAGTTTWQLEGVSKGIVELLFTANSNLGIKKTKTISIEVGDDPDFTFSATASTNNATTNKATNIGFEIKETVGISKYLMTYASSKKASFVYDSISYKAGENIPILAGVSVGQYTGEEAGNHTIIFKVTNNNATAITKTDETQLTVKDADTAIPEITLLGDNPQNINQGDPYVELGAITNDDSEVTIDSSAVNSTEPGTYTVTYTATNTIGTAKTERTVNVIIVDTSLPTLILQGDNPQIVQEGETYIEAGATTNADSGVTIGDSTINTAAPGTYTVFYEATNNNGTTKIERTVIVNDIPKAVITASTIAGNAPLSVTFTGNGSTNTIGTINHITWDFDTSSTTSSDLASPVTFTFTEPREYTVTLTIVDEYNAQATVEQTITVNQQTPPILTIDGANPQIITEGSRYTELGATTDDGSEITIDSSEVNVNQPGTYTVSYTATNSGGTSIVKRQVIINDKPVAVIVATPISGNAPLTVSLTASESANTIGNLSNASWNFDDGTAISSAMFPNAVNHVFMTSGTYTVTLTVTDQYGAQGTATRNIIVNPSDTTPPVITINGPTTLTHTVKTPYVDPGATATDNVDGSTAVTTTGNVNVNVLNVYTITYTAEDAAGNRAQKTRTVNVVDNDAPVITVNTQTITVNAGDPPITIPTATANDNYDGNITSSIERNGTYRNTLTPGNYTITYDVSDSSGNAATQKVILVNVVSVTPRYNNNSRLLRANPGTRVTYDIRGSGDDGVRFTAEVHVRRDRLDGAEISTRPRLFVNENRPFNNGGSFIMPNSGRAYIRTCINSDNASANGNIRMATGQQFRYTVNRFPTCPR